MICYGLICGAVCCAHNIGNQCVKEAGKVNSDIVTIDFEGRCVNFTKRQTLEERLANYDD